MKTYIHILYHRDNFIKLLKIESDFSLVTIQQAESKETLHRYICYMVPPTDTDTTQSILREILETAPDTFYRVEKKPTT